MRRRNAIRIEQAELRLIEMPLRFAFHTSAGVTARRAVLLLTLYGEGLEGYGECVAPQQPTYREETVATALMLLEQLLLPRVVGRDFPNPRALARELAFVRGNAMAKATVEMAFWDLWARGLGRPLWQLLGGVQPRVPAGVAVGIQPSLEATVEAVERYLAEGYLRVKLKVQPGWDVEPVQAVRARLPQARLAVDCNGAYTRADVGIFRRLDELELDYIEQPLAFDDLADHAWLQSALRTPLCLAESITSPRLARQALAMGACRVLNVKPGRLGGLDEARRVHDLAEAFEAALVCGGMLETGVGRAHNLHLATLPHFRLPVDMAGSSHYWEKDIVNEPLEARGGWMEPPPGPGIGVTLNRPLLEGLTIRQLRVRP